MSVVMTSNSNLVAFVAAAWIAYCIYRFTKTRLEYRNLPGPPHSFFFGHLPAYVKTARKFPRDAHSNITLNALATEHNLVDPGCFYVDAYPIRNDRQLIITSPEVAAQVVKADKHPFITNVFGSVLGRKTMALSNGSTWKSMRATFAASFAPSNLLSMMPAILDESELFVSVLTNAASKDGGYVGSLSHMIQSLSFDLVCRLVLGKRMMSQIKECELADLLHAAAELPKPASLNPLEGINVLRISAQRRYERVTKEVIDRMILERWDEVKKVIDKPESQQSRFIIDMALKAALRSGNLTANQDKLPQSLIDLLSDNVKGFVFGGEDTLANALAWTFFEVSRHPDVVAKMRQEHDHVFGKDPEVVSAILRENPRILKELTYTTAVIKESLRMYPPGGTLRIFGDGTKLKGNDGREYPTKGHMIYITPYIMQRSEKYFPNGNTFDPERWLNDGDAPRAGKAWRPFEHGPRSCAGQELAMIEMQAILALVTRKFEFREGYTELSRREGREIPRISDHGDWAYPITHTTRHPACGLPMLVKRV